MQQHPSTQPLWYLQVPIATGYAELQTLYVPPRPSEITCRTCKKRRWPYPLSVEWEFGSDSIPDFVNAGARIVARESVADSLLARFTGFVKGPVTMPDHPALRKPAQVTSRTRKRVWLPYQGPPLVELLPTLAVPLVSPSTVSVATSCQKCGSVVYASVEGVERKNSRYHNPRQRRKGLFVRAPDVGAAGIFRPQYMGFVLCTDSVRSYIRSQRFSNVEILRAGDILPG